MILTTQCCSLNAKYWVDLYAEFLKGKKWSTEGYLKDYIQTTIP